MIARTVSFTELAEAGKWRADLHVHGTDEIQSQVHKLVKISDFVTESKSAIDPATVEEDSFFYIGLEHVAPITGDPVNLAKVSPTSIRSRSKTFEKGDILYGRLRPYLRKAMLVEEPHNSGLCSTEFIVLKPNKNLASAVFLRELLVSEVVTERLTRMQGGAALPRVSSKDLLNLSVPLPPLEIQREIEAKLLKMKKQRRELAAKIESLKEEGVRAMEEVFE